MKFINFLFLMLFYYINLLYYLKKKLMENMDFSHYNVATLEYKKFNTNIIIKKNNLPIIKILEHLIHDTQ